MIGINKLYLGQVQASDTIRYERQSARLPAHLLQFSADPKPVVVWNCTQACNLDCIHCYAGSGSRKGAAADELGTAEARAMIADLAAFGVPVLLFSGGEPLVRPDLFELVRYAGSLGLRTVLSTNGTLIDAGLAAQLKRSGVAYVGISLDGLEATHDHFRGRSGAFQASLAGIRACREAGLRVGLRFTVTRQNLAEIPGVFALVEAERISRVCFYHVVPSGRAAAQREQAPEPAQTRRVVEQIIDHTVQLNRGERRVEVLTVANHADGPHLVLRLQREGRLEAAENALALLAMNGGNSSGNGIGCIGWNGRVYADQFWRQRPLGTVTDTPFSVIWGGGGQPLLASLRQVPRPLKGRCARCRFLGLCNGNLRARAEALTGDPWASDPACYLSDAEIRGCPPGVPQA